MDDQWREPSSRKFKQRAIRKQRFFEKSLAGCTAQKLLGLCAGAPEMPTPLAENSKKSFCFAPGGGFFFRKRRACC
jgi:hypothetical protein